MPSRLFFSEREIAWFDVNHQLPPAVPSHVLPIRVCAKPIIILSNEIVGERGRLQFRFRQCFDLSLRLPGPGIIVDDDFIYGWYRVWSRTSLLFESLKFEFPCLFVSSWFADTARHRMTRTEKRKKRPERCEMFPSIEGVIIGQKLQSSKWFFKSVIVGRRKREKD